MDADNFKRYRTTHDLGTHVGTVQLSIILCTYVLMYSLQFYDL